MQDFGYFESLQENFKKINETQEENIKAAAKLMADAIENDRLINVYGGGGHTTLPVGEMFFRAGGLSCINPCMETGLSVNVPFFVNEGDKLIINTTDGSYVSRA